jgi:hypothetical protein
MSYSRKSHDRQGLSTAAPCRLGRMFRFGIHLSLVLLAADGLGETARLKG